MSQPLYLPLVLLAAVVGSGVGMLAWVHRDRPGAKPLTVFVVAASFWAVAEGLNVASGGLSQLRFWKQLALTLSTIIPLAWLVTVLEYTGRKRWLTRRRLALLLVHPFVFTLLVWTNGNGHELIWRGDAMTSLNGYTVYVLEFGLGFWAHQVYVYLLVAAGAAILLDLVLRTDGVFRSQGTALLGAVALPMIGNALYVFRLIPRGLDITALGYVLAGVIVGVAMFERDLFAVAPLTRELGRETVVDQLDDAVVIADDAGRLVDANPAAKALFDEATDQAVGRPVDAVFPELAPVLTPSVETADGHELRIERDGRVRYYDVRVSALPGGYGAVGGRVVSLRDVTDRRQREERLDVLNRLLRHNIRNEMNVVRGNAELAAERTGDAAVTDRLERVIDNVDTVIDRSDKMGVLARTLDDAEARPIDIVVQLREVLADVTAAHPDASVETDFPDACRVEGGPALAVVWRELVTNAIEHTDGEASVEVAVDSEEGTDRQILVRVADDGPGLSDGELRAIARGRETPLEHGSGLGLWMVHWVVRKFGGNVTFADTDDGTTVEIRLPRADEPGAPEGATATTPDPDRARASADDEYAADGAGGTDGGPVEPGSGP